MNRKKIICLAFLAAAMALKPAWGAEKLRYNRDVRPILAENCFACHGPDSASRKGDLRLDQREWAIQSSAFVPGKPAESEIINRIKSKTPEEVMPPPASHKKVSPEQLKTLEQWITEGANYEPHWSLIAPVKPAFPAVKSEAWIRNPIDRFILAKLEEKGLEPAGEADRRSLIRRVTLDLTGLPPKPEEVEAFALDNTPDAYEKLVDRLLSSKRWGEHRGRYWLDAARYADTHGIHFDNYREMWSYRDWVINSLNANQPFDKFTIDQLAGDLLPNSTLEQRIASGFNRCNITTNEGGAIAEEYLVLYTRDRTETAAQVWLGLTANCSVCHDHKFDPLSQKEFYELSAFFNNTTQGAMDGNISNTPPVIPVPPPEDRVRFDQLAVEKQKYAQEVEKRKSTARGDFDAWLAKTKPEDLVPMLPRAGLELHVPLAEESGQTVLAAVKGQIEQTYLGSDVAAILGVTAKRAMKVKDNQQFSYPDSGDFEKNEGFTVSAWVRPLKENASGALLARMDESAAHRGWDVWFENGRIGSHIIHRWPDDALKVVSKSAVPLGKWSHVAVVYDGTARIDGLKIFIDGIQQEVDVSASNLRNTIKTQVPLKLFQRSNGSRIANIAAQDVRLYRKALPADDVKAVGKTARSIHVLARHREKKLKEDSDELFTWWLPIFDKPFREFYAQLTKLEEEDAKLRARTTVAHIMNEKPEPAMAYILYRGDYDKRRDAVKPATPRILPPMPADLPRNRLGLAQWLLRPDHPLTARVTVNRFWQELFGTGIVRTPGDFGVAGELPSHPELLDWLAIDFRENGWDIKRFFKQMVMSSTYRQSAMTTPQKLEKDAHNRLLSRGPRFRMDAEMVRDYALSASGLLSSKIGGPSVRPYQPEGVWEAVAMIGSNTRDYRHDTGENLYRRSMYTFWKRAAPPASMEILNAPNRETCTVKRERTNTPLQALVTLNDPQFVESARMLAQQTLQKPMNDDAARIDSLARSILCRPLTRDEASVILDSLKVLADYYAKNPADAQKLVTFGDSKKDPKVNDVQLATWTMLTNELFNLDEVLNK